jgi:hypothetical protein
LEWRKINPDIFGSMIQAVTDDDERGALGMHYTSVPNILKVLNPLFLDDLRDPPPGREWVVCRSTEEALAAVAERGMPTFASLDHDLGGDDTAMVFLRRLAAEHWDGISPPPESTVHSANPVGKMNIISFMDSWRRSSSFIQGLGPRGGE